MSFNAVPAGNLDWLAFADDIHAPPPDLFEFELDKSLNGVDQSQLPILNGIDFNTDPYQLFRSDSQICGPPSSFTVSSESTYESRSAHSDSLYSFPRSPTYTESVYSNDLQLNFAKFSVDAESAVPAAPQPLRTTENFGKLMDSANTDANSFGDLPITPYDSMRPAVPFGYDNNSVHGISPADFYLNPSPPTPQSLHNTSTQYQDNLSLFIPGITVSMSEVPNNAGASEHTVGDTRRKYHCPNCPRSFARAYNLKTHLATHDPHRPKPFTCPHPSCGRSFSRKHDLGRHLVSIHHDDPDRKRIGVESGTRTWCESCGKSTVGATAGCTCAT